VGEPLAADGGDADATLAEFEAAGIDLGALAAQLQREEAEAFSTSWRELLESVASKRERVAAS
jgi:transaldolase